MLVVGMFFTIKSNNGLAIFEHSSRQIKFGVASGALEPGELVPSVREVAQNWQSTPTPSRGPIATCKAKASAGPFAAPVLKSPKKLPPAAARIGSN